MVIDDVLTGASYYNKSGCRFIDDSGFGTIKTNDPCIESGVLWNHMNYVSPEEFFLALSDIKVLEDPDEKEKRFVSLFAVKRYKKEGGIVIARRVVEDRKGNKTRQFYRSSPIEKIVKNDSDLDERIIT